MRSKLQRPEHHSDVNPWQRWALNIGAVLGSFCLLIAVATLMFGLKPLIFASGSMGPGIPTGSLGLAVPMPVSEVIPGQVVSVVTSDGTRVTHRVVENRPEGLILKGDDNSTTDLLPYQVVTADRLLLSVPVLGYVVSWLSQPWAFFIGGLMCAYLLYLAFFRRESDRNPVDDTPGASSEPRADIASSMPRVDIAEPSTRRRTLIRIGTILTALAVVVPLGAVNSVERTQAAWSSSASALATITATTLVAPAALTCNASGTKNKEVVVSWSVPNDSPVEQYEITVAVGGQSKTATVSADTSSQVLSLENSEGLLGRVLASLGNLLDFLFGGPKPVDIDVVAVYPGGWKSAALSGSSIAKIESYALISTRILCS
jgi:signal peptidase I